MNTAVIVGRFQTPILHAGHLYLIGTVLQRHDRVLIILGTTAKDERNPFSLHERWSLIHKVFPQVQIRGLNDRPTDEEWSKNLDDMLSIYHTPILYHSRDSFVKAYSGKYETREIPEIPGYSATKIREQLKQTNA